MAAAGDDALSAAMLAPQCMRNVAIVAHVDHGKTTLADALVARAGRLAAHKAGTERDLDTDAQEQERGITINGTAASLLYPDIPGEASDEDDGGAGCEEDEGGNEAIHVGNLPYGMTEELVRAPLEEAFGSVASCDVRSKRGFAWVSFEAHASRRAALAAGALEFSYPDAAESKRWATLQAPGGSPRIRLRKESEKRGLPPPSYSEEATGAHPTRFRSATVRLGDGQTFPSPDAPAVEPYTRNAARDAAAVVALEALRAADLAGSKGDAKASPLLIGLVDCPGHVDFSAEVTTALRISDGALIVVDAVEGPRAQTETVMRQAVKSGARLCLCVNKVDRLFMEQQLSAEAAYDRISAVIDAINELLRHFAEEAGGPERTVAAQRVSIEDGSVSIASGYYGFGFTAYSLAELTAKVQDVDGRAVLREFQGRSALEGTHASPSPSKRARRSTGSAAGGSGDPTPSTTHSKRVRRATIAYGLRPIAGFLRRLGPGDRRDVDGAFRRLVSLGIAPHPSLPSADALEALPAKAALRSAMGLLMPLADAVLGQLRRCIPSPVDAQRLRFDQLYSGPSSDDPTGEAIAACSTEGPVFVAVTKLTSFGQATVRGGGSAGRKSGGGRRTPELLAFGRVLSGTVRVGMRLRVLLPGDTATLPTDRAARGGAGGEGTRDGGRRSRNTERTATVTRVVALLGSKSEHIGCAGAGAVVALQGVAGHMGKSTAATLVEDARAHPMPPLSFAVTPVLAVSISTPKGRHHELPRLIEAAELLARLDSGLRFRLDPESGENVLHGAGELHLDVAVKRLSALTGMDVQSTRPAVALREACTARSDSLLAKSTNKKNRVWARASPLPEDVIAAIESDMTTSGGPVARFVAVATECGWRAAELKHVIAVGPEGADAEATCVLIDSTEAEGRQAVAALRDSLRSAFLSVCGAGPITNGVMRGVCFEITDALAHRDSAHRGAAQTVPAAARAMKAAFLAASPCIMEPRLMASIVVDAADAPLVHSAVAERRGVIVRSEPTWGGRRAVVDAELPGSHGFELGGVLRGATSGRASLVMSFAGWQLVPGQLPFSDLDKDTLAEASGSEAGSIVLGARARASITHELHPASHYADRL